MARALIAALVALAAIPASANAQLCAPPTKPRASVAIIWSPWGTEKECEWFAQQGYRARVLKLPGDDDWRHVWRDAVELMERMPWPRYAYGWSRAGSVAELLALRRHANGAIAVGAPTDLTKWWNQFPDYWERTGMTMEERRAWSPLYNVDQRRPLPMLLAHSHEDTAVPFWHSRKLHKKLRFSELVELKGEHTDDIRGVHRETRRFLARR